MTRQAVKAMKRAVAAASKADAGGDLHALARDSALGLLERSIGFGHGRLAVLRLSLAAKAGAEITLAHWAYCEAVARRSRDPALEAVLARARAVARPRADDARAD